MEYKSLGNYFYYTDSIAQGSFSNIYRGYRISDRQPIAVKKLTRVIDEKYINSEIELMEKLDCDNILKLYEVIKHKNYIYLILEYCNQGDLSTYIKSSHRENNFSYIYQILNGLKYLYHAKIIHRDIKPQNILINNFKIKICDFGFAKKFKDDDVLSTFCGSPLYMAPEILKFEEYTEKADIWSLGVIVFEILFKRHPYPSKNKFELINNIKQTEQIKIPKTIDPCLRNLLKGLLDKDDSNRLSWNEIFNHKWFINYNVNFNLNEEDDVLDFESVFTFDDREIEEPLKRKISYSVCEFKKQGIMDDFNSKSVYNKKQVITKLAEYDDCKVYSRSAPSINNNNYLENYININSKKHEDSGYKILGTSPNISNNGFYNYLNKSVNTIKNLFNM